MSDDLDLHIAVSKGAHAEALLKDDLLVGAFDETRADIRRLWLSTNAADTEGRERLWMMLKLTDTVWAKIEEVMVAGKIAQAELDAES
jgi:hypothetical protein